MNHFSKVGKVLDVRLIPSEKGSRKSRGFGYIEFDTPEQAIKAVTELTSEKFQGRTLFVQSQVERLITTTQKMTNVVKNTIVNNGSNSSNPTDNFSKLFVGNFDTSVSEDDLREVLKAYGVIEYVDFHPEEAENSKGFAYVW